MNISLPKELKMFVDKQVKEKRYASSSEYIRQMLREKEIFFAEQYLRNKLEESKHSGYVEIKENYFTDKYFKNTK